MRTLIRKIKYLFRLLFLLIVFIFLYNILLKDLFLYGYEFILPAIQGFLFSGFAVTMLTYALIITIIDLFK